jgi:membrane-bound lytic murein transglycosylase D
LQEYGRCLLKAAEAARLAPSPLVGTASMATGAARAQLTRRFEMLARIAKANGKSYGRLTQGLAAAAALGLIAASAFAARGAVLDRRLTLADAQALVANAPAGDEGSSFPMVVDELVLEQLNRYVGTPDGRRFMRGALDRMQDWRALVESRLAARGLPLELAAIPIVESGYRPLPESENPTGCCSGLWQFRRETARRYGLRVDDRIDERRIEPKATEAAIRYLIHDHEVFRDWPLAVAAYNMGEVAVRDAIAQGGTGDAWELARRGKLERYLSAVMAAIIIVKNPSLVDGTD